MHFPSIFCTWEWIYTWWEHFGVSYDPFILFLRDGSELVGILPLARRKTGTGDWLRGRTLTYCGSDELYPDHLDIICAPESADACLDAVFDFLLKSYKNWGTLRLSALAEDSMIVSRLKGGTSPFRLECRQISVAPFIPLVGSFDDYTRAFDGKRLHNLKKGMRKLYEQHNVRYVAWDHSRQSNELKMIFHIHELRAKKKNIVSTFQGDQLFEFHKDLISRLHQLHAVWIRFLKNEENAIAALYAFSFEGRIFSYQRTFDPDWDRFGPGIIIAYEAIQEGYVKGFKEFNFLRGGEGHKSMWTRQYRALFLCNLYNKSIQGGLSMASSHSIRSVKQYLKKLAGHGV